MTMASMHVGGFVTGASATPAKVFRATRFVRRSHPRVPRSSPVVSHAPVASSSARSHSRRLSRTPSGDVSAFTAITARRRASPTTATTAAVGPAVGPAFELAAGLKAPGQYPEAVVALALAVVLLAFLGRDDNCSLLLATITFRAMSVASVVNWWLSPVGHAVAFAVLAIRTFLAGGVSLVRVTGVGHWCAVTVQLQSFFFLFFSMSGYCRCFVIFSFFFGCGKGTKENNKRTYHIHSHHHHHAMTTRPYATGAGRLDALLNAAMMVGLLIITAPKEVWAFVRGSKWGQLLNAVACAYLLFAHVRLERGGGSGGGVNHASTTVGFAALLLLSVPGFMR